MEPKYYIDKEGRYLGAFVGETGIDFSDAQEVLYPPEDVIYKWTGKQYE